MRLFPESTKRKFPSGSTARAIGLLSCAEVAGPPSPAKPAVPFPATVLITPSGVTLRIRLLLKSAMKRLPAQSKARPVGELSFAEVAGPPSPEKPSDAVPTTVLITPSGVILQTRLLKL